MPQHARYLLSFSPHEQRYAITHGSLRLSPEIIARQSAWEAWLHTVSSFAFDDREGGHCTIRKEQLQRGDGYWYAYRSIRGRTKKRYLGRTADLTLARLEEVSIHFMVEEGAVGISDQQPPVALGHRLSSVAPLLETKLHPPQLPAWLVERMRLRTKLDGSLAHRITLLLAPAGFGKTTLVNQWLNQIADYEQEQPRLQSPISNLQSVKVAWVSLEASDNDPLRFWRYVMTAYQRLLGQERRTVQAALALLTAAPHPPFDSSPIEMALTEMLNALAELSGQGLLVLDDYHAISEPRIHETLAFFVDHLPKSMHVLLLSRTEPDLPLLRWRARGEVIELHVADLRFSTEETAAFLHQALPITLSEAALARLDSFLEGWAAGLRLLSLALAGWRTPQAIEQALRSLGERASASDRQIQEDFPHRLLLDYFATEILATQPEPTQRFLLQTSVLSRLCAPLCDAVIASEGSGAQLAAVARAGLFLEAMVGPGEWYRYHALFAEAMRREASRRLGEAMLQERALRASLWYEQAGMLTEAIDAAWLALESERVATLIEQIDVFESYEPQTMRRWLERLPADVLREHPMLCHLLAVELCFPVELRLSAMPVSELAPPSEAERVRIEALLQMADEAWQARGMLAWVGANWAFRSLKAMVYQEPFSALLKYAQQALVLLPQGPELDRGLQMYRASSQLCVGIEKLRLGQIGEAQQLLSQAQRDNVPPGNTYLAADIRLVLGKCYLLQGELKLADSNLRQAIVYARELNGHEIAADALLELAWLAFEWNDLPGAEQQAREAQELAQRLGPAGQAFADRAMFQLALIQHVQGEAALAMGQVAALLAGPQQIWTHNSFWLCSRLRSWHVRLGIAAGDLLAVQASLEAQAQSSELESITDRLSLEIGWGRLWLAQGNVEAAREQLTRLLPLAQATLHQYLALEIELLLALTHAAHQQEQQAHYWLRQALAHAAHEGYVRLFLSEGRPMLQLLRSLLGSLPFDTALRSSIQRILRASPSAPRSRLASVVGDGQPIEPLTTQEQRVLRLLQAAGRSNQEIARELVVSVNTVKYHTKHLYQKLGVSNRLQASAAARALSLDVEDQ